MALAGAGLKLVVAMEREESSARALERLTELHMRPEWTCMNEALSAASDERIVQAHEGLSRLMRETERPEWRCTGMYSC